MGAEAVEGDSAARLVCKGCWGLTKDFYLLRVKVLTRGFLELAIQFQLFPQ